MKEGEDARLGWLLQEALEPEIREREGSCEKMEKEGVALKWQEGRH